MLAPVSTSVLLARFKAAKRLPSPPGTALQVLALCRADDVEVQRVADTVMSDPSLAARILRFANSPLSGLRREVTSIREAVLLLGLRTVKLTALGFSLATPEMTACCPGFDIRRFWAECFLRAVVARRIAEILANADREDAFTAGLLAGIGRLALAQGLREEYGTILAAEAGGKSLAQAEHDALGTDHVQIGAELLRDWQLPAVLVEAVAAQQVIIEPQRRQSSGQRLAQIVRMSNEVVPGLLEHRSGTASAGAAADAVAARLGIDVGGAGKIVDEILADYQKVSEVFDVSLDNSVTAMDLYAEAQEEATRVGMVAQLEKVQAEAKNQDLLRRATTDALTGIANRAKFDERIREEAARFKRNRSDFALIIFDIDHFKQFNDTHGHQVGDLVLKRVATAVRNALRDVDLVARYGGEEFAVLAVHTDRKGACIVNARLQRSVEELRIDVNGQRLGVTISSGLVIASDYASPPTPEQLIADSDAQLYISKKAGRNTWSYLGRSACKLAGTPLAKVCGSV